MTCIAQGPTLRSGSTSSSRGPAYAHAHWWKLASLAVVVSVIPPFDRPMIAYLDFTLVAWLVILFVLGLLNRRTPSAHKRYMVATAFIGWPPALTRFYSRLLGPATSIPNLAIHLAFLSADVVLLALIIADWQAGERRRWAFPMSPAGFASVAALMTAIPATGWWQAFYQGFAAAPAQGEGCEKGNPND